MNNRRVGSWAVHIEVRPVVVSSLHHLAGTKLGGTTGPPPATGGRSCSQLFSTPPHSILRVERLVAAQAPGATITGTPWLMTAPYLESVTGPRFLWMLGPRSLGAARSDLTLVRRIECRRKLNASLAPIPPHLLRRLKHPGWLRPGRDVARRRSRCRHDVGRRSVEPRSKKLNSMPKCASPCCLSLVKVVGNQSVIRSSTMKFSCRRACGACRSSW